ncbi:hypothetical protein ACNISW_25925, partial [Escherichia coli]
FVVVFVVGCGVCVFVWIVERASWWFSVWFWMLQVVTHPITKKNTHTQNPQNKKNNKNQYEKKLVFFFFNYLLTSIYINF